MKNNKGFATIYILLIVLLAGGVVYAVVQRNVLKSFFETGDKPTADQFADTIDSSMNLQDDGISSDSKVYNPTKNYEPGDTVVNSQLIYQAKIVSEDQKEFKLDAPQPVTFRWTAIVPKPQESVMYRIKVWQLMQGQNSTEAMRTNQPTVVKDVDNLTEATINNIYTGPCKPPYLCDFVWGVEVVSKENTDTGASTDPGSSTH